MTTEDKCRVTIELNEHQRNAEDYVLNQHEVCEAIRENQGYVIRAFEESEELRDLFVELLSITTPDRRDLDTWPLRKIKEVTEASRKLQYAALIHICQQNIGAEYEL